MRTSRVPESTGPYGFETLLARGGMAEIYLARMGDGRRICIKQIRPEYSDDPEFADMFRREAGIVCALNHPNIVQTIEFNEHAGRLYIAMEFVDGPDLKTVLRKLSGIGTAVPPGIAFFIIRGLLKALQAAHELSVDGAARPVIHRDVSPHNILLSLRGEVKLADFGIAKAKGASSATRTGVIKGKLAYLSPEQAGGESVEPSSDLYCAGLVLFEMLSGRRFHIGANEQEILASVLADRPCRIPWLSESINGFIEKLLRRRPADRFADAAEALNGISELNLSLSSETECADFFRAVHRLDDRFQPGCERDSDAATVAVDEADAADAPTRTSKQDFRVPEDVVSVRQGRRRLFALAAVGLAVLLASGAFLLSSRKRSAMDVAAKKEVVASVAVPKIALRDSAVSPTDSLIELGTPTKEAAEPAPPADKRGPDRSGASPTASTRRSTEAPTPRATGLLEVSCRPWALVSVGDRELGTTPIRDVPLPEGQHRVRLVNDALGAQKIVTVEIQAGKTSRVSAQLP